MKAFKIKNEPLLKLILQIDAIFGLVLAAIGLGFTNTVSTAFALPFSYVLFTTLIILTYSSYTWVMTRKVSLSPQKVYLLFLVNCIWAIKPCIILYLYSESASGLGIAFLIAELTVVIGFAALQRWQLNEA